MDRPLHIQILEVLQQRNAIGTMADIKPMFEQELITQAKRKNFKLELDYLMREKLIEPASKFDFLNWEVLDGLYPLDNKKIEAKLVGNWQAHLSASLMPVIPEPVLATVPQPSTMQKLSTYNTPSEGRPFTSLKRDYQFAAPVEDEPVKEITLDIKVINPAPAEPVPDAPLELPAAIDMTPEPDVPRIKPTINQRPQPMNADTPIITARTAALRHPAKSEPSVPSNGGSYPNANQAPTYANGTPISKAPVRQWQPQPKPQPVVNQFNTANNPFAALQVINLAGNEKPNRKFSVPAWLKWAVAIAVFIMLALLIALYKHKTGN